LFLQAAEFIADGRLGGQVLHQIGQRDVIAPRIQRQTLAAELDSSGIIMGRD
jgi:hypothetical protein